MITDEKQNELLGRYEPQCYTPTMLDRLVADAGKIQAGAEQMLNVSMDWEETASRPDSTVPPGKCARTACEANNAVCVHTQTGRMYCPSCARKINEHNPGLVRFPDRLALHDEASWEEQWERDRRREREEEEGARMEGERWDGQ